MFLSSTRSAAEADHPLPEHLAMAGLPPAENILVHACCGPCLEYPARQMLAEGRKLTIYAYNPNIHPLVEHQRREENLVKLTDLLGLRCFLDSVSQPEFWVKHQDTTETRCHMCYRVRLEATARKARDLGIPYFTTTLLVSPYQDQEMICEIGAAAASRYGVTFYARDFRPGYRQGQEQAKQDDLYRQKYCGCLPSIDTSQFRERILKEHADLSASL